ncbi:MAG: EFR1 family ferrodoxin [Spirochaetaceae bacterium]|nr:EFR1 family ferrodoxin [Spirochaetaceae bacterium]
MTKIFYFSGTGNTLWSAKHIGVLLAEEIQLFNIGRLMQLPAPDASAEKAAAAGTAAFTTIEAERVIVMFPAYAFGMPHIVRRFLCRFTINAPYIAALVTCGTSPGGALAEAARVLKRRGRRLSYAAKIPCVENYIPIFGPPPPQTVEKRLAVQRQVAARAASEILQAKTCRICTFRPFSAVISALFRVGKRFFVKWFQLGPECNACGLCAKICPAGAITMPQGKPVFSEKCEHCQACLNWCPQRAISFIRLKPDTPRYHHPAVKSSDMAAADSDA